MGHHWDTQHVLALMLARPELPLWDFVQGRPLFTGIFSSIFTGPPYCLCFGRFYTKCFWLTPNQKIAEKSARLPSQHSIPGNQSR